MMAARRSKDIEAHLFVTYLRIGIVDCCPALAYGRHTKQQKFEGSAWHGAPAQDPSSVAINLANYDG